MDVDTPACCVSGVRPYVMIANIFSCLKSPYFDFYF